MRIITLSAALAVLVVSARGQDKAKAPARPETEADFYAIRTFTPPPGEVLEAGAIEALPDGRVAVGTRRGEIWMIDHAYADDPTRAKFTRFAHGLHEVL